MKWYENFMHKLKALSHCALIYDIIILGYLLYQRVQDVLHDANHCEKSSSKLFEERCSIFAAKKVTNQPKPEGFFTQTNRRKITAKNPN